MSQSSDSFLSSSILHGIKLLLVLVTMLSVFALFMLLSVVAVVLDEVKSLLESFTMLFVIALFVLLFVAGFIALDGIKMLLVSITVLLFVFALFELLVVVVVVVALTDAYVGNSWS